MICGFTCALIELVVALVSICVRVFESVCMCDCVLIHRLQSEVDHLDDAHVYLDDQNPSADAAVDLLLGTQGWRRFAFVGTSDAPYSASFSLPGDVC